MKKGFTLVELLSVIVILSMIGIITAPMVIKYVNTTKIETYRSNVQTLIEKTTEYVNKNEDNNDYPTEGINIKSVELNLKNNKFKSGIIKKDEQGKITAINVYDGEYCANGTKQNLAVEKVESVEECKSVDGSKPILKIKVVEVTATKVLIVALGIDKESGIKDYKYCIGNECTNYINENKYEFKNLKSNQEYEITVTVRNNKSDLYEQSEITETTEKIKIITKIIDEPQFKISSSSYAGEKEVTITYPKKEENYIYGYIIEGNERKEEVIDKEEITLKIIENAMIKAYIKYGNEEITNEIMIVGIDNNGPEVKILMEPNWTQNKQIIIETKDNGIGLATNAYSYDGGKNWTSNNKRTFRENQTIKVIVRDKLGNETGKYKVCDLKGENCKDVEEIVITTVDNIAPELQNLNGSSTTNSINLNYNIKEEQSGIKKTTCKYGESSGSYTKNATSVTNTNCKINGLEDNKTYYYQICVTDNVGNVKCTIGAIKTKAIINPVLKFTNTPAVDANGYLYTQLVNITYTNTNITTPTYYVKTTREGTSNINVTQSCGTATVPNTCTNISSTKNLLPNMWYKVSGNINITYNQHNDSFGTIYAVTYDGVNYSAQSSGHIFKIDREAPTCGNMIPSGILGTNGWYISNINLSVSNGSDNKSGHASTVLSHTSITSETTGTTVTLTTTDKVGNKCSINKTFKIDKTNPICGTISISGTTGLNGWHKSDVTISKNDGSDALSGHASTTLSHTSITTETAGTTVTLTTTDNAGNICTTSKDVKIDKTAPTCSPSKSNTNQTSGVTATFTCDDLSGVTCTPQKTGLKSNQSYTITDNAGNQGTCSVSVSSKTQYQKRTCSAYKADASKCGYSCSSGTLDGSKCKSSTSALYDSCKTGSPSSCVGGYVTDYNSCSNYGCYLYSKCCPSGSTQIGTNCYKITYYSGLNADTKCSKNCSASCSIASSTSASCSVYTAEYGRHSYCGTEYVTGSSCTNASSKSCIEYGTKWDNCASQTPNTCQGGYYCNSGTLSGTNCITSTNASAKSCEAAGCNSWGSWTSWTDSSSNYCTNSNSCQGSTRTVYY